MIPHHQYGTINDAHLEGILIDAHRMTNGTRCRMCCKLSGGAVCCYISLVRGVLWGFSPGCLVLANFIRKLGCKALLDNLFCVRLIPSSASPTPPFVITPLSTPLTSFSCVRKTRPARASRTRRSTSTSSSSSSSSSSSPPPAHGIVSNIQALHVGDEHPISYRYTTKILRHCCSSPASSASSCIMALIVDGGSTEMTSRRRSSVGSSTDAACSNSASPSPSRVAHIASIAVTACEMYL
jgi:hypothetical protein